MNSIEGIDYYLVGINYKAHNVKIICDTFDNPVVRNELEPLWHIIDAFIDRQARDDNVLYGDADNMYIAIEDFCKFKQIKEIPILYETLFRAKVGFFTMVKYPNVISNEWKQYFNEPINPRSLADCPLVQEFKTFLDEDKNKNYSVLLDMELFGFPYDFGDEDEDEDEIL